MTIKALEDAIQHSRDVTKEWDDAGAPNWLEDHTRYAVIDPILRALGWDTADPKECHPEYPRPYEQGRVDYALFGVWSVDDIATGSIEPVIIIEAKALRNDLNDHIEQLEKYVEASPSMKEGVAVLTNGIEWRLYSVEGRGRLAGKRMDSVDILKDDRRWVAQTLHQWLGRHQWRDD